MPITATPSSTFSIGGDLTVNRLGYGAMQLTGPGVWGEPADRDNAVRVARHTVELGINFIDTADSYGPGVSEEILAEALHPYPDNLIIATKAGLARTGPGEWPPLGRPEYLRQQAELSLRRLRLDRIDLFQLHRIDPQVPLEDQLGALRLLQETGKIRHIGLSEVTVDQLNAARNIVDVVSVQNLFNATTKQSEDVLEYCQRENLAFIPWFPIASGRHAGSDSPIAEVAREVGASPSQVSLAWLLYRSPVILPIPGTKSMQHLEENAAAGGVTLTQEQFDRISALA
ncbi:MAG TPA: aldo/keto reductase [Mycobacteriales bacterium]|nr:aldo/keto reductase [Mycobacteriales bacterium]